MGKSYTMLERGKDIIEMREFSPHAWQEAAQYMELEDSLA